MEEEPPYLLPTILALPAPNSTSSYHPLSRPLFIPNPNPQNPSNPTTIFNLHNYHILQALPALPITITNYPQTPKPPAIPSTPSLQPPKMPRSFRGPAHVPESPTTGRHERRTRSQAAPDWTTHETLVLISQMAALDESWLRALSAHQRWTIVAEDCAKAGVVRSYGQCKRRWEGLLADYARIQGAKKRGKLGLQGEVDDEVFAALEAVMGTVIKPRKEALQRILESEHEDGKSEDDDAEMVDEDGHDLSSEEKDENDSDKTQDMVTKLQENADKIQGILRGELEHNSSDSLAGLTSSNAAQLEFTRQQADELIKALGSLSNSLHQFAHLIKAGECEGIRPIDSMAT